MSPRPCLLLLLALGALLAGCQTSEQAQDGKTPSFYLTFHQFSLYQQEQNRYQRLEYRPGREVYVDPVPVLTSAVLERIEPLPGRDGQGLRCHLDRRGRTLWAQVSGEYGGRMLVLMRDGTFRSFVRLGRQTENPYFDLTGPFADEEAQGIVANVAHNYGLIPVKMREPTQN